MEASTDRIHEALDNRLSHIPPGVAALYRELVAAGSPTPRVERQARYWEIKATLLELSHGVNREAEFWPQALATVRHLFGASQVVFWVRDHGALTVRHRAIDEADAEVALALPLLEAAIATGEVQTAPMTDAYGHMHLCLLGPVVCGDRLEGILQVVLDTAVMRPEPAADLAIATSQLAIALEAVRRVERLTFHASHDPLTGLANRRHFDEYVDREFKLAKRHGTPMSLLVIDVDHFKRYNDTHGHPAGDRLLQALAGALSTAVRSTDFTARLGGEEFVIVLPHTGARGAYSAAQKVLDAIRDLPNHAEVLGDRITASIGVATGDGRSCQVAGLLEAADQAMYRAKQSGRNRICQAIGAK